MPHAYILASKSILSAFKYIRVPLLLNKEQISKVLEKISQADPTSILSFIVSFLGKGILYTCSIHFFIFHSLLFKMTSLMHDLFNVGNGGGGRGGGGRRTGRWVPSRGAEEGPARRRKAKGAENSGGGGAGQSRTRLGWGRGARGPAELWGLALAGEEAASPGRRP